jgi:glycosyltransferase involved in cell wall biosynthesis
LAHGQLAEQSILQMHSSDLISVVITTYNRSDALAVVLAALAQQDDKNFEVVVADDGSTVEHQRVIEQMAQRLSLPVTHVWHPDVGFTASKTRNRGVSVARGRYVILLDGDCVPEHDFIRQHRTLREQGCYVNGSRVMLSPALTLRAIQNQEPVSGRTAAFWLTQRMAGHASKLTGLLRLPSWGRRRQAQFIWRGIRSCNMGVWREDFVAINGFDESFVGWGHEDADFALRLHNHGIRRKNGYCSTEVFHLWHPESTRMQEQANARKVMERQHSGLSRAPCGFLESKDGADMVVSHWGSPIIEKR